MRKRKLFVTVVALTAILFSGCNSMINTTDKTVITAEETTISGADKNENLNNEATANPFDLAAVPSYTGNPYTIINENKPYFSSDELSQTASFESYSELDELGRCGVAYANIGQDLMPTEERGAIGMIKPSGWHTIKYDFVDGRYLYNRCHLIGFQLTGENANEKNLVTGTRYLNVDGMLPFENMVADYIKETGNHVLYRVTPEFADNELVCRGVLMEAKSLEDDGIEFCVFVYNVQPGVTIDYETGDSFEEDNASIVDAESLPSDTDFVDNQTSQSAEAGNLDFVINRNTGKFHKPSCSSVSKMSEKNKEVYTGRRDDLINQGYEPCGSCNP